VKGILCREQNVEREKVSGFLGNPVGEAGRD